MTNVATYVCAKCGFIFKRTGEIERCEDCGSVNIRHASDEEIAEYERNQLEFGGNK